jgi:dTDP-4-dehydrorhamnose reductase
MLVNGTAVAWLADACAAAGAHLVQLSTDYVFDGTLDRPYREDDEPNPQSAYGRSKLAGEQGAATLGAAATIVRTSWVCGAHGSNMVRTVLRLMGEGDVLRFVDDQRGNPTFAADLAPMLLRLAADRVPGIVHVTNQGAVSWYEFVREIVTAAGGSPDIVIPITTAELDPPRPAPRPANSVLDNTVLPSRGIELLRHFRGPLGELVAELRR